MASGSSVRSSAITSSLTHSVSTASAEPRQPAVFGSGVMPSRLNRSSMPVPPSASTRRIATAVSSVPEATSASSTTARLAAPPVPMISRDAKLRPAIVSFESAPLHRRHHLELCTIGKRCGPSRSRQYRLVDGHRNTAIGIAERPQQRRYGRLVIDLEPLRVDNDHHAPLLLIASLCIVAPRIIMGRSYSLLRFASSHRGSSRAGSNRDQFEHNLFGSPGRQ